MPRITSLDLPAPDRVNTYLVFPLQRSLLAERSIQPRAEGGHVVVDSLPRGSYPRSVDIQVRSRSVVYRLEMHAQR